jgi:co-chaperonin GroES (HSP10)
LQKGDVVICDDWLGEEGMKYKAVELGGEKVIIIKEHNIMAKVVENGNESG